MEKTLGMVMEKAVQILPEVLMEVVVVGLDLLGQVLLVLEEEELCVLSGVMDELSQQLLRQIKRQHQT
jgi:hypothetical protein